MYFLQRHSKALLAASWVLLLLGIGFVSQGQTIRSNPLTVGGQAVSAGQYPGTTTNDTATAGNIGEVMNVITPGTSATVTFTNGQPTIGWTTHGLSIGSVVNFTTTGGLPTNFSVGTNYYVIAAGFTASQIEVSATPFGTAITAGSAGTGTQTGVATGLQPSNATPIDFAAVQLTAGNWECSGQASLSTNNTSSKLLGFLTPTSNSATGFYRQTTVSLTITGATTLSAGFGPVTIQLAGTTNLFADSDSSFSAGSASASGNIHCVRSR